MSTNTAAVTLMVAASRLISALTNEAGVKVTAIESLDAAMMTDCAAGSIALVEYEGEWAGNLVLAWVPDDDNMCHWQAELVDTTGQPTIETLRPRESSVGVAAALVRLLTPLLTKR